MPVLSKLKGVAYNTRAIYIMKGNCDFFLHYLFQNLLQC